MESERLGRTTVFTLIALVAGFCANYFMNVVIARTLGPELYGDVAVSVQVLLVASIFAAMGADSASVKFLPPYIIEGQWSKFRGFIRYYFCLILLISVLLSLITLFVTWLLYNMQSQQLPGAFFEHYPIVYGVWFTPLFAGLLMFSGVLLSFQKPVLSIIPYKICYPATAAVFVLLLGTIIAKVTVVEVMCSLGASMLLFVCLQLYLIHRHLPGNYRSCKPETHPKLWVKTALPFISASLVTNFINQFQLIFVEIFHDSETDVGYFAAIVSIVCVMWLVDSAMITVASPKMSQAYADGNMNRLKTLYRRSSWFMVLGMSFIALIIVIFSKQILSIFGPTYVNAQVPLIVAAIGTASNSLSIMAFTLMKYAGQEQKVFWITLITFSYSILASIILINLFGLIGAVIAMFTTRLVQNFGGYLVVRKHFPFNPLGLWG